MSKANKKVLLEGILTNGLFKERFGKNKNVLLAITGPTGSGKSYACLRIAELWYQERFHKPFPPENICFSNGEAMKLISSGKLEKGELLVLEEVGVNLGSLDFQQKASKMFVYILQSFRSMNIGLLMNLPVLTMLNKGSRQLLHGHMITTGIDSRNKQCKLKLYLHQLNQNSGKSYWKYPRIKIDGKALAIKRLAYNIPTSELSSPYESKKLKYLTDLTTEFSNEYDEIERDKIKAMARDDLTDKQREVYNLLQKGYNQVEIARIRGVYPSAIWEQVQAIKNKGYSVEKVNISLEKQDNLDKNEPIIAL
jgi:DNA-binding CsgD family transcriptional regulator